MELSVLFLLKATCDLFCVKQPRIAVIHCVSKKRQLWNGIARNYNDWFWWHLAEMFKRLHDRVRVFQFSTLFSVSGLKDEKLTEMQTYVKTETCKLYSRVFWIFLPNVIKINPYTFELYRFKVGAFLTFETLTCIHVHGWLHSETCVCKPFHYVTNHVGQLSLLSLRGR